VPGRIHQESALIQKNEPDRPPGPVLETLADRAEAAPEAERAAIIIVALKGRLRHW
jgi:hypothetical protein